MLETIDRLKSWEMKNNGEQTFSKAFDLLASKLQAGNTERRKLIKNSSSRKVIVTDKSHLNFAPKTSDRPTDFSATKS
jgi:hypothetical protein